MKRSLSVIEGTEKQLAVAVRRGAMEEVHVESLCVRKRMVASHKLSVALVTFSFFAAVCFLART